MSLLDTMNAAYAADRAFRAALDAAGYRTQWEFHLATCPPLTVEYAYIVKVECDNAMHAAFAAPGNAYLAAPIYPALPLPR